MSYALADANVPLHHVLCEKNVNLNDNHYQHTPYPPDARQFFHDDNVLSSAVKALHY